MGANDKIEMVKTQSEADVMVALAAGESEAIACTLAASGLPARVAAWKAVLEPVVAREPIDGGLRLLFPRGASLSALAELAAAEQECCSFFRFAITIDGRGAALDVTAPADAFELVDALFGPTA